jgi:adenosylhomocysteine nucleosidase
MEQLHLTTNPIFLVALEVELPSSGFPNLNIQYTGVGKVNAAYHTMKSIQTYKPTMVINFGSAGAVKSKISGLVQVSRVIQRDMDVQGLGFELGQTPFETGEDSFELEDCSKIDNNHDGIKVSCSTGDNFVSEEPKLTSDIVDMELYAIAKICSRENVPLFSWKYISDQADGNSPKDWENNVSRGVKAFKNIVLSQFTQIAS